MLQSVQSLGGAQRLRQQQKMLEHLSADAAGQLNTVQHQLQSQLELLLQQREQQQQQHPDASGECTSQQRQQQKLLALEGNTQELIECARMYTSKLLVSHCCCEGVDVAAAAVVSGIHVTAAAEEARAQERSSI